jgi:hypothetical protein
MYWFTFFRFTAIRYDDSLENNSLNLRLNWFNVIVIKKETNVSFNILPLKFNPSKNTHKVIILFSIDQLYFSKLLDKFKSRLFQN